MTPVENGRRQVVGAVVPGLLEASDALGQHIDLGLGHLEHGVLTMQIGNSVGQILLDDGFVGGFSGRNPADCWHYAHGLALLCRWLVERAKKGHIANAK